MSTEVTHGTSETFNSEPKIYISKATLKLKINTGDYAWRTEVITPQQTTPVKDAPETEVAKKHVNATNAGVAVTSAGLTAGTAAAVAVAGIQQHKLPKFYPSTKPVQMKKAVSDFMQTERCHTENIENMNQFISRM